MSVKQRGRQSRRNRCDNDGRVSNFLCCPEQGQSRVYKAGSAEGAAVILAFSRTFGEAGEDLRREEEASQADQAA